MNNLSELIIRGAPTPEKIHQAEAWAKQADSVIQKTKQLAKGEPERAKLCEHVLTAVLFNLASLREVLYFLMTLHRRADSSADGR
jgi:hypothetical protein